jgi:hypothetical protein
MAQITRGLLAPDFLAQLLPPRPGPFVHCLSALTFLRHCASWRPICFGFEEALGLGKRFTKAEHARHETDRPAERAVGLVAHEDGTAIAISDSVQTSTAQKRSDAKEFAVTFTDERSADKASR